MSAVRTRENIQAFIDIIESRYQRYLEMMQLTNSNLNHARYYKYALQIVLKMSEIQEGPRLRICVELFRLLGEFLDAAKEEQPPRSFASVL